MESVNMKFPLIIGIVGDLSSGKETVAKYLKDNHNFEILLNYNPNNFSLGASSDANRESFDKNFLKLEKEDELDNIIKEMNNKQIINNSRSIKQKIRDLYSNYTVIYPYLSYDDYILLSNKSCFRLFNILCPTKRRYYNFITKNPHASFENFLEIDYKNSTDQNLNNVRNLSQYTIHNDTTLQNLYCKLDDLVIQLKNNFRPSWQDYFMSVAHIVAHRSNCVKQKVGTVIVRDGRIMATGYNGTPAGIKNCYEGGCERCNLNVEQGLDLDKCFCLHSEENAVIINIYMIDIS